MRQNLAHMPETYVGLDTLTAPADGGTGGDLRSVAGALVIRLRFRLELP